MAKMNMQGILKWILGIVLGVMLTSAVALGGWNLKKTAEAPEKYATKIELEKVEEGADVERKELKQDVERGFDQVIMEQRAIKKSLDKIVDHLLK